MWNFKLQAGNLPLNCQNATSATHPKTQLATHLKNTKLQRKCCVDASSRSFLATHLKWRKPLGNAPQNTNPLSRAHPKLRFGSWQRTWNYRTHLKSHCRLPCQHAAGMRIWERNAGRGETPKKQSEGWKTTENQKTASKILILDEPWFLKPKHTNIWSRNKRENICKTRSPSGKWTAHLDLWKTGFTATQQGRTKKNDIIQDEQFATVVLKFKPQVADKSEINHNRNMHSWKIEVFISECCWQHPLYVAFHTCMPPCQGFQARAPCLMGIGMERTWTILTIWSPCLFCHFAMLYM